MADSPKTIQIFLPSGDPRGIRISEITTRIVQVIEVPRSLLPEFLKMDESGRVAVYFLFGGEEDERQVYIGQTGDLRGRLKAHQSGKEFWERALVLVSRTENMTQTHALYLEWLCIQQSREAGRYKDQNGNSGSQPYTTALIEAECQEFFETAATLFSVLGYPIFSSVSTVSEHSTEAIIYMCTAAGSDGRGFYTPDGFVVLKGSVGKIQSWSDRPEKLEEDRHELANRGVVQIEGDRVMFLVDHLFNSPSAAAVFLAGYAVNGWKRWKADDGRTLHDVERVSVERDDDA